MLSVWLAFGVIPLAAVTVMLVVPVAVGVPGYERGTVPVVDEGSDRPAAWPRCR